MFWTKDFIAKNWTSERVNSTIFFLSWTAQKEKISHNYLYIFRTLVLVMRLAQELSWQFLQTYINSINGFDIT